MINNPVDSSVVLFLPMYLLSQLQSIGVPRGFHKTSQHYGFTHSLALPLLVLEFLGERMALL